MTSVGLISLRRVHFSCPSCGLGGYPLDDLLGVDGFLSKQARRVVCFIAGNNSFAWTESILREVCGWSISDELIRHVCYRAGERIEQWLDSDEQAYQQFIAAAGQIEVEIDAAKVNTVAGWRDMKMVIFAKREAGEKATPEQWAKRDLPAPTARMAFAKIEEVEQFSKRTGDWMTRLAVIDTNDVTVLADGAEWIWNLAKENFPFAFEVLDVFHVIEHLGTAAKKVHGEGSSAAQQWQEQTRQKVLQDGWWGLCERVGATLTEQGEKTRAAMEELLGYFSKHTSRMNYCARLYGGRTIGSGMVEGAAKNLIGKRLKQTKARWLVENVQKMAVLCCSHYSDTWTAYWTAA
jgi:hypothetical protein